MCNQTLPQPVATVNATLTTATGPSGLELLLLPGEDAAAVLGNVEAFLDETEARPWIGFADEPTPAPRYSAVPQPADCPEFYHRHGCDCPRCTKAHGCQVQVHGVGAGAIGYRIQTPEGKEYMPVVNIRSRVVTCNCANGRKLYRATCYHAQAAWLNYLTDDPRTALQRRGRAF